MSVMWGKNAKYYKDTTGWITIEYPSTTNCYKYTGNQITPIWENLNTEEMYVSGDLYGTDCGLYRTTFTPKEGYKWENGSYTPYSISWRIALDIVAIPVQNGTLKYNTVNQSPSWNNYDNTKMVLSGITTAKNAGNYTAIFTLISDYVWEDGTIESKNVVWTISKGTPVISISPSTLRLSLSSNSSGIEVSVTSSIAGTIPKLANYGYVAYLSVTGIDVSENPSKYLIKPVSVPETGVQPYVTFAVSSSSSIEGVEKRFNVTITA